MKRYRSYSHSEAQTGIGQLVDFSCDPENTDEVKRFIEENIRGISLPSSFRVTTSHGTYGRYSRYNVIQHKYAGGNCGEDSGHGGYSEVLEIQNPPDGRCPFVIYEYTTFGRGSFSEWNSLAEALDVWKTTRSNHELNQREEKPAGFKGLVNCGFMTPWFYAIGDEVLHGDYAITSGLEDDPVFRLGRRFVVQKSTGLSEVRTCMGCRFYTEKQDYHPYQVESWRMVYFDDGTTLNILKDDTVEDKDKLFSDPKTRKTIRPFHEEEAWIDEAMNKFRMLLSGMKEGFQIKFDDGSTFTAKIGRKGKKAPSVEGKYTLKITYDGGKVKEGWTEFTPSVKYPDIVSLVHSGGVCRNVEKVEIVKCEPKSGGKKWSGVYFHQLVKPS